MYKYVTVARLELEVEVKSVLRRWHRRTDSTDGRAACHIART